MITRRDHLPLLALLVLSVVVLLQEPFAPLANNNVEYDPGVYIFCAKNILQGKLIYRDIFDHKGPLLYLINVVGLAIGNGSPLGIWLLDIAFIFAAGISMYRSALLLTGRTLALLAALYALLLAGTLELGDSTQLYALPFMAASLHLFLRCIIERRDPTRGEAVAVSIFGTLTFLLQPNLVVIWLVFGFFAACRMLSRRRYRTLFRTMIAAVVAAVATLLPFAAYFLHHGILKDAFDCYWVFNRAYSHPTFSSTAAGVYHALGNLNHGNAVIPLLAYLGYLLLPGKKPGPAELHPPLAAGIALTLVLSCGLSGRNYPHYAIAVVPLISITIAFLIAIPRRIDRRVLLLAATVLFLRPAALQADAIYLAYKPAPESSRTVAFIRANSREDEAIAVVGNDSQLYYRSGRRAASRYHYTIPLFDTREVGKKMAEEYRRDILAARPRLIIVRNTNYPEVPPFIAPILAERYARLPFDESSVSIYRLQ